MSRPADQLDQFVEALMNGETLSSVADDPELEALFDTAKLVHDVTESEWPGSAFAGHLAADLAIRLQAPPPSSVHSGTRPLPTENGAPPPPITEDLVRREPPPRPWYREGLKLVAGVLVVVAVGALLAATLGGQLFGEHRSNLAAQPGTPQSIYDTDPDLKQAHQAGWGREVDQPQASSGFTVTLRWAGSDAHWLFAVLEITGPPDHTFGSILPTSVTFSLPDGTLQTLGMSGCSKINGTFQCAYKYARPASLSQATSTLLTVEIPALHVTPIRSASGTTAPRATSESGSTQPQATSVPAIPYATPTQPSPNPEYVPGPFTFVVPLPLQAVETTPTSKASSVPAIFGTDPDLQRAYQAGWGKVANQTQSATDVSVILRWVGSDTNWIFLVFDITPPAGWSHGFFTDAAATITLPDGTPLTSGTGGCNKAEINGSYACMLKYSRPASIRNASSVALRIEIPKLSTVGATPPSQPIDVPGPFTFNATVPVFNPSTVPSPTPLSTDAPQPSRVYVIVNGFVDVLDTRTGDLLHQLPMKLATQSPFIAADATGDRLFVTDAGPDGDMLMVYRTSDWSIERQVPVPDIIREIGPASSGIASSADGRYVYVYNYNDRTRGSSLVDYWLATYDVQTGNWLDKIVDLPNCGLSQLLPGAAGFVSVRCFDTGDVRVVDPINGTVLRTSTVLSNAVALGQNIYSVAADGALQVLNTETGSVRTVPQQPANTLPLSVPRQPIGISLDGSQLYVPVATANEYKQGLAHAVAVIDTTSGQVMRMVEAKNAFSWIAFAPDGSVAYLQLGASGRSDQVFERLDLQTSAEQAILQGPLTLQMVIAP